MGISNTNGGAKEAAQAGSVVPIFQVMSNELSTPKVLVCPSDPESSWATNFVGLANSNISYFAGVDVTNESNPQLILSGDSNLQINGKAVKSGQLSWGKNDVISWQPNRHRKTGYIGLADGSAAPTTTMSLGSYFAATGIATNRLAIP